MKAFAVNRDQQSPCSRLPKEISESESASEKIKPEQDLAALGRRLTGAPVWLSGSNPTGCRTKAKRPMHPAMWISLGKRRSRHLEHPTVILTCSRLRR